MSQRTGGAVPEAGRSEIDREVVEALAGFWSGRSGVPTRSAGPNAAGHVEAF
jgi:hypothetical protein